MLALSGVFHILVGFLALTVSSLQRTPIRLEPVAVVNLIGGGEFLRDVGERPGPPKAEAPSTAPPSPKRDTGRKVPPPPRKAAEKAPAKKKAPEVAARGEFSTSKKRVSPDESPVAERLRRMREARTESNLVRSAVEEHRREAAARAAVRGVGERVARRIEGPPPANLAQGAGGGGFGGGSQGTVRVSPELLEYFRKLEERVRESWVLPEALVRDAGKLMVEMRIVIEKDGRVSDTRIEKGSGNVYFDESVRRAIRKASPVPVPPERLRGGEDHYEVGFRFHGSGGGG
jgi:colicin import membrane protein